MLGLWRCTLVRGDPWTDAKKTGADVMDSHDVVCIFFFICGGATCWLTRWLIGGDQRCCMVTGSSSL